MPAYKLYKKGTVKHRAGGTISHVTNKTKSYTVTPNSKVLRQSKSAYAQSLLDPFTYKSVRIPDLACYPTATYTSEYVMRWVPGYDAAGANSSSAIVIDLTPNPQFQLLKGQECSAQGGRRTSIPSGTLPPSYQSSWINSASTKYSRGRLVSAGIVVEYCGNDASSQGTITVLSESGNTMSANLSTANDVTGGWLAQPSQQRQFYQGPLRDGARAIYRPLDASSFDMLPISSATCFGQFIIALAGMSLSGTAPNQVGPEFLIHIVANFEGQITDTTSGAEEEAVVMDIDSFQHGLSVVAGANVCTDGTTATLARKTAEASNIGKAPSTPYKKAPRVDSAALMRAKSNLRGLANRFKRK